MTVCPWLKHLMKCQVGEKNIVTGPEMVPEARRSPGLMLQPVTVW